MVCPVVSLAFFATIGGIHTVCALHFVLDRSIPQLKHVFLRLAESQSGLCILKTNAIKSCTTLVIIMLKRECVIYVKRYTVYYMCMYF